jgi:hypothetical protein
MLPHSRLRIGSPPVGICIGPKFIDSAGNGQRFIFLDRRLNFQTLSLTRIGDLHYVGYVYVKYWRVKNLMEYNRQNEKHEVLNNLCIVE